MACREFREAKHPGVIHPVSRRCIDDLNFRVANQGHGFARRIVGQAQENHVSFVEQPRPLGWVFALGGVDREQRQIRAAFQPLPQLQPGCACLSIDEN